MSEPTADLLLSDRSAVYSRHPADLVTDSPLIGTSVLMRRLRERIARVARSPLPVLITGPTGSGKELVARAATVAEPCCQSTAMTSSSRRVR